MNGLIKAFTTLFPAAKWFSKIHGNQGPKTQGSSITYRNPTAEITPPRTLFYDISGN
ncbi:MAG TPA: hypothetical protein VK518_17635 [Puia sp.]|nr:hypothetical protein [Puia sp.]